MSEGVCRDITIFNLESRTPIAAKRSRSEREAADAFVSRRMKVPVRFAQTPTPGNTTGPVASG
jgi:hypothetical protein